jgi:hypothetical protein
LLLPWIADPAPADHLLDQAPDQVVPALAACNPTQLEALLAASPRPLAVSAPVGHHLPFCVRLLSRRRSSCPSVPEIRQALLVALRSGRLSVTAKAFAVKALQLDLGHPRHSADACDVVRQVFLSCAGPELTALKVALHGAGGGGDLHELLQGMGRRDPLAATDVLQHFAGACATCAPDFDSCCAVQCSPLHSWACCAV